MSPPDMTPTGLPWGIRVTLPTSVNAHAVIRAGMDVERAVGRLVALIWFSPSSINRLVWEEAKRREKVFAGLGVASPVLAGIESVIDDVAAGRFTS